MSFVKKLAGVTALSGLTIDADKVWQDGGIPKGMSNIKEVALGMALGDMIYFDGARIVKLVPGPIGEGLLTKGPAHSPGWGYVDTGVIPTPVTVQVAALADDSSQNAATSAYDNSVECLMGKSGVDGARLSAAMIFRNINIPSGAVIGDSRITFTASASLADTPLLTIMGESAVAPAAYGAAENFTLRAMTVNSVTWITTAWTINLTYQSPNIQNIIQELYLAHGPFVNATIALQVRGFPGAVAWIRKTAYSYNTSPANAPLLLINYTLL